MIWILQTIIAIFCCKDILHRNWIKVVFCLEYFCHKQLQIALMNSPRFIAKLFSLSLHAICIALSKTLFSLTLALMVYGLVCQEV